MMYGLPASADGKVAERANTFCQITRDHPGWTWVSRLPELWWARERGQDHQPHLRAWPTGVANRPTACLSLPMLHVAFRRDGRSRGISVL